MTGLTGVPGPLIEVTTVKVWLPDESVKVEPETGVLNNITVFASDAS